MEWTEKEIEQLRALWTEGLSTSEIGRRMGISKNAVVGKAHRLNLPARPNPIRRGSNYTPRPATPRRVTGPTLPLLAIESEIPVQVTPTPPPKPSMLEEATVGEPQQVAPARSTTPRNLRAVACCWPIGEPGSPSFRFCDADAASSKPYCLDHVAVAYVKVRDRREDAA